MWVAALEMAIIISQLVDCTSVNVGGCIGFGSEDFFSFLPCTCGRCIRVYLYFVYNVPEQQAQSDRCIRALFRDTRSGIRALFRDTRSGFFVFFAFFLGYLINQLQCWAVGRWIKALFCETGEGLMFFFSLELIFVFG
jgi:hypothetical protein